MSLKPPGIGRPENALHPFELLAEHSRDIILFIRRDDGRILDANSAAVRAYGYSREELLALSVSDLRDDRESIGGQMAEAEAHSVLFEAIHRRKDGSRFPVEVSSQGAAIGGTRLLISLVRDVTERKRTEDALRESEERLRRLNAELAERTAALTASEEQLRRKVEELQTVMDVAPVAIWVAHDPECNDIVGNPMANRFYEAGESENVSANLTPARRFFHRGRELSARELPMQEAAARGQDVRDAELDVLLPSGARMTMLGCASPLRDRDGQVRGCVGAFLDITARKDTEEALRESEVRFRAAFDHAATGMVLVSADGRLASVNDAMCEMLGYSHDEMAGKHFQEVTHPDDFEVGAEAVRRMLSGEAPRVSFEKRYVRKDGGVVWAEVLCTLLRDNTNSPFRWITQIQDVTERKQAEEILRQASEQRRLALEAAELGAWDYRFDTGEVFWDERCRDVFGVSAGGRIGYEDAIACIHPEDRPATDEAVNRALAGAAGGTYHREFRVVWPDGSVHWVASHGRVYFEGEGDSRRAVRFIGVNLDATRQKNAERALRESEDRALQRLQELEAIYAGAPVGLCMLDAELRWVRINERMAAMNGFPVAEHIGARVRDLTPQLAEVAEPSMRAALETGMPRLDIEIPIAGPQGIRTWRASWLPLKDSGAKVIGLNVVAQDVTEQKRVEQEIREAHDRQEILAEVVGRLLASHAPQTLVGDVAQQVMEKLDCHIFFNLLADPKAGRLRLNAWSGINDDTAQDIERLAGDLIPEWPAAIEELLRSEGVKAYACQPLLSDGTIIGALSFGSRTKTGFSPDELSLIRAVANHIAVAMDRIRVKTALSESEARLRITLDGAQLGTFDYRPQTGELFWDERTKWMWGLAPDERLNYPEAIARIHPEDRRRVEETVAAALRPDSEGAFESEYRIVWPDGSVHWTIGKGKIYFDRVGTHAARMVGIHLDTTERKRVEETLRQTLARAEEGQRTLAALMEYVPEGITIADAPDVNIRHVSRYGQELLGGAHDGSTAAEVAERWSVYEADGVTPMVEADLPLVRAIRNGETVRNKELVQVNSQGRSLSLLCNSAPIYDSAGRIVAGIVAWRDISERRQAEEALRESEARLRFIIENSPDSVFIQDSDFRCAWRSKAFVAPEDSNRLTEIKRRVLDEGVRLTADFAADVDGERRHFENTYAPWYDAAGRITGILGYSREITERKRADDRLRQAQKLESIGLLAGGIAHDFNNLLTGIMGNASLALEEVGPETASILRGVVSNAERAAHLTRQLLAYSGKGQFFVQDLDFSKAVRDMAEFLRLSVPKSVDLRFDLQDRLPLVSMDAGQLQQVVMNLVINAGEAIGQDHGLIVVSTRAQHVPAGFTDAMGQDVPPGRYVCLEVADNGSGMDDSTTGRIFDPFFTTKFTGRGLGLAAVSGILRSLKGAVRLVTAPGKGTTFTLFFRPNETSGGQLAGAQPAQHWRGTVLVVDDEPYVRNFISMALGRHEYRVEAAANGEEALAVWDQLDGRVDLVILDVVMPVMGGSEMLTEIKRRRPDVQVLLTSGYSEAEAKRLCAAYGATEFIQKPYTAQTLVKRVDAVLSLR